jgi:uncharacterized membrane protein YwzB
MSNANKDDKLVAIRAKFGMWGIGVYWSLIEFVAEQVKEKSETAEATLIVSELLGYFVCRRQKLVDYLVASAQLGLIAYSLDGNILNINIPKMLDYADNYIKYDGKSLKTLQRQEKMSSKQEENRTDKNITCTYDFESVWKRYPRQERKKDALKHFRASVKTDEDWHNINLALDNYCKTENVQKGIIKYIQQGGTWFNNWQDYVSIKPIQNNEPLSGLAIQMKK